MIRYAQGNLLDATAEALVNTVNEVGVMGKGIALMFREAYPGSARVYQAACRRGEVSVGKVLVTATNQLAGPQWIIHFPTKRHWRNPSNLEWIRAGLSDLAGVVQQLGIRSIALPPLGCGNGGLAWAEVRDEIQAALSPLEGVEVEVFEPAAAYLTPPKPSGLEELTPARALVAEMIHRYAVLELGCTHLEVQKLAWFLERATQRLGLGSPLGLAFTPDRYGPYADGLRHLLNGMDGSYLHSRKRLADAGPFDSVWLEPTRRQRVTDYLQSPECMPYEPALRATAELIDGFESPLGMELLATTDWLLQEQQCEPDVAALRDALAKWPGGPGSGERKLRVLDARLLAVALQRLDVVAR